MKPIIVAVAGISGSGKSTAAMQIEARFGADNCAIISCDRYYREQVGKTFHEREKSNYDEPSILEFELLDENLTNLRLGNPVKVPKYDFSKHQRFKNADGSEIREDIFPKSIIIVDGILIYEPEHLQNKFDVPVFVDTPTEVAAIYRIARDIKERGRDFEGASLQCLLTVFPSQNKYVLPHKEKRNDFLIVKNNKTYTAGEAIQFDMEHVFAAIQQKLDAQNQAQASNVHRMFGNTPAPEARPEQRSSAAIDPSMYHAL